MFESKFAIVLRDDLAPWQALNVTAYLTSGIIAQTPEIIGGLPKEIATRFSPCAPPLVGSPSA